MDDLITEFHVALVEEFDRLSRIPPDAAARPPAPGKWSPKEIVGHLVDSACNNHQRFVRAQLEDGLTFDGYDQNEWVRVQRYASESWPALLALWRSYNLHIIHVIEGMSPENLSRLRSTHNLDQIAWRTVLRDTPASLEYFVRDYLAHMKHHLEQIA